MSIEESTPSPGPGEVRDDAAAAQLRTFAPEGVSRVVELALGPNLSSTSRSSPRTG